MTTELVIEIAPFTVASGTSAEDLFAASERLDQDFLSKADGYIGRILVQKDATEWADIVFWKSPEHAQKAVQAAASSAACRSYFQCMSEAEHDEPGQGVTLFRSRKVYGSIAL